MMQETFLKQQWQIISTALASTPLAGKIENIMGTKENPIYWLAEKKQYAVIGKLLAENLITAEQLTAQAQESFDKGTNALWWLARHEQGQIISDLVTRNLITTEQLTASPQEGPDKGTNVLWWLARHKQGLIVRDLVTRNLITTEQLTASPQEGPEKGTSVLWLLNNDGWLSPYHTMVPLLEKNLITAEQLAAQVQEGFGKGMNALWALSRHRNCRWIMFALLAKNLITTEQLTAQAQEGSDRGMNFLFILMQQHNWAFINLLLDKNLVSIHHLFACVRDGFPDFFQKLEATLQWGLLTRLIVLGLPNKEMVMVSLLDKNAPNLVKNGTDELRIALNMFRSIHNRLPHDLEPESIKDLKIFFGQLKCLLQAPIKANSVSVFINEFLIINILRLNYPNLCNHVEFSNFKDFLEKFKELHLPDDVDLLTDKMIYTIGKIQPKFFFSKVEQSILFFSRTVEKESSVKKERFKAIAKGILTTELLKKKPGEQFDSAQQISAMKQIVGFFKEEFGVTPPAKVHSSVSQETLSCLPRQNI